MGYQKKKKTIRVEFDDGEFAGLWVRMKALTVGQLADLSALAGIDKADVHAISEAVPAMVDAFAAGLVDWNLEDDEVPVLPSLMAVRDLDFDMLMAVYNAWLEAAGGVSAPLGPESTGGSPSLEASIPMVPSSVSLVS